jgi:hypothetical protein
MRVATLPLGDPADAAKFLAPFLGIGLGDSCVGEALWDRLTKNRTTANITW